MALARVSSDAWPQPWLLKVTAPWTPLLEILQNCSGVGLCHGFVVWLYFGFILFNSPGDFNMVEVEDH